MDESRTEELRQALLEALKERTKLMCMLVGAWGEKFDGQTYQIGHDKAFIELRAVGFNGSGRHTLLVRTENTRVKTFRQTGAGRFPIPHVAKHILGCVEQETQLRQDETRQRQLSRGAGAIIQHLTRLGLPPNMTLTPSETPGAFDLTATALTEVQVRQAMNILGPPRSSGDPSFWEQLNQPDD